MRALRGLADAVVLAVAAAVAVAVVEVGWLARTSRIYFDGWGELGRFALCDLGLLAGAGLVAGLVEALLARGVGAATTRLEAWRPAPWRARLYAALGAAPIGWVCAQVFRGPRAQKIPGHALLALGLFALALGGLYLGLGLWARLRAALAARPVPPVALAALAGLALATVELYAADQRILPRLYAFFHLGLDVLVFAGAELVLAGAFRLLPATRRRIRAGLAVGLALAALGAGALALSTLSRVRGLRTLALERSAPMAPLLRLAERIHPPAHHLPAGRARHAAQVALPQGPRLGDDVDVFLITVDAMRADRLAPAYAPRMSALARSGVTFARAYAQVPHTSFSVATLLTGKYVYALSALGVDISHEETLPEVMRRERYKTAAFFPPSVFYIDADRLRGFQESCYGFEYVKLEYLGARERTDQVIDFLSREQPPRAFVWVHYLEPHEPYELHPGITRSTTGGAPSLLDRYDGEVRFVDGEVGRLVDWERAHRRRALVVLAADHGEEFGEHGGRYHGTTLYEEQVRVPLAFAVVGAGDGARLPERVVHGPVGLVDVMPTLLALTGIMPSARLRGRDLSPWMSREGAPDSALGPVFAQIGRQAMVVDGEEKLICDLEADACQLFDLARDPAERRNLADDDARLEPLRGLLDDWMTAQARFEQPKVTSADPRVQRILDRGRLGDRGALKPLAGLLSSTDLAVRREAVRLLVSLPADPAVAPALARAAKDADAEVARWAEVGEARLGDATAKKAVAGFVGATCQSPDRLCAEAAIALGDVPSLARALDALGDDFELALRLVDALGRSRSPAALDPLIVQLGAVRTRLETVRALSMLGNPGVLPTVERWVAWEPYVPVRAQMAALLGQLGGRDANARRVLRELSRSEREPPVMRAVIEALALLGAPGPLPPGGARSPGRGELWLAGEGEGSVEVTIGRAALTAKMHEGVARLEVAGAGPIAVRVEDGSAVVRHLLWRRSPDAQRTTAPESHSR